VGDRAICFKSDHLCSVDECSEPNSPALERELGLHSEQLRRTSFEDIAPVRGQAADVPTQTADISVQTEVTNHTEHMRTVLSHQITFMNVY